MILFFMIILIYKPKFQTNAKLILIQTVLLLKYAIRINISYRITKFEIETLTLLIILHSEKTFEMVFYKNYYPNELK